MMHAIRINMFVMHSKVDSTRNTSSKHLKGRLDPPVSDRRFCLSVCNVFVYSCPASFPVQSCYDWIKHNIWQKNNLKDKHLKGRLDPPVSDVCLSVCLFVTKNDHFAQRSQIKFLSSSKVGWIPPWVTSVCLSVCLSQKMITLPNGPTIQSRPCRP